jgi:ABC-type multidrug transport system ATPase subunit
MKITDLKISFGKFSLHIGSLSLAPGRIYGLIGPNGCGKTTLLKLMSGLLAPDSGIIDCEGLVGRDITMAPRKPYFLHDTVYRNLIYPLSLRGIKSDKALLDYYLELAGLKERQKQYAPSLSTGEQQKLALIRAMIFSPKLILIDEAFSSLDMESAGRFEQEILKRQEPGQGQGHLPGHEREHGQEQGHVPATYVICSHQLSHIQRLCSHVYFMWDGAIESEGPVDEILLRPESPNLRNYLQYTSLKGI